MEPVPMSIPRRETELAAYLARQPYEIEQDGVRLIIAKNVFPSDFGLTSSFVGRFMLQQAPAEQALDMACGSGYFAFLLKKIGCRNVVGVDFNPDAIDCARGNNALNPSLAPVEFVLSDLFTAVPPQRFGLIMFNFNYYPSDGTYGLNGDGGREILERFFSQVGDFIEADGRIFIPYSEFVGDEHDPKNIAPAFGFSVETLATIANQAGRHFIYRLVRAG